MRVLDSLVAFLKASWNRDDHDGLVSRSSSADLNERRIVSLVGQISDENATQVIAKLLFLNDVGCDRPILLLIDSPGGSVSAALAISGTVRDLEAPVYTRCVGEAQGMASIILASGRLGDRTADHGAVISVLAPELLQGDCDQPEGALARLEETILATLVELTGGDKVILRTHMLQKTRFSPDQAKQLGFIDAVKGPSDGSVEPERPPQTLPR